MRKLQLKKIQIRNQVSGKQGSRGCGGRGFDPGLGTDLEEQEEEEQGRDSQWVCPWR